MATLTQQVQPNISRDLLLSTVCATGLTIKATISRVADGFFYDSDDGDFKDFMSVVDPYVVLVETPPGGGNYSKTLDVTPWIDGNYTSSLYDSTGASPVLLDTDTVYVDGGSGAPTSSVKHRVDHNYSGSDSLRYITAGGDPIEDADIYVFDAGTFDSTAAELQAVAVATTGDDGRWLTPIFLDPGQYVVYFYKKDFYGPDTVNITVV